MAIILRALPLLLLLGAVAAWAEPRLAVWGNPDNAFIAAAAELRVPLASTARPGPDEYDALLLCAPDYPRVTALAPEQLAAMQRFLDAGKTVYVEYAPLPGLLGETPQTAPYERLCLPADDPLHTGLPARSLLEEHASQRLPLLAPGGEVLLSYGRVAGTDQAVYGLDPAGVPALVSLSQGHGRLLLATTALSNWQRGRYRPTRSWEALTRAILLALLPPEAAGEARARFLEIEAWTEPRLWAAPDQPVRLCVRAPTGVQCVAQGPAGPMVLTPAAGELLTTTPVRVGPGTHQWRLTARRGEATRELTVRLNVGDRRERYRQTVARNLAWFERAGMLIAPDGSLGVREGFTNQITPEGKPTIAGCPRVDCISECGLLFAVYGRLCGDRQWLARGQRMLQYTARAFCITAANSWYFGHWQSRGEFRDDGSTLYVFNDDSGAGTLFSLLGYAETGEPALLATGLRGVEYFCHTATRNGLFGYMPHRDYEGSGHTGVPWPTLRDQTLGEAAPHVMNLPLASLLVAYQLTGERRYLDLAERGCRTLMTMYPRWHLVTSRSCEHARMLLPLALLQRVAPTPEHRQWLDTVAGFLVSKQDACGAIREWDGYNPASNAAFGTTETSVFQQNGDPISDQLYDTGFAVLHLALAAQVTGDPKLRQAAERLGDYLTRVQIAEPGAYEGTWLRAFDFGRWEYFGSSADVGWGPYCSETGWMCAPLGLGLLLLNDPTALRLPAAPVARPAAARAAREAAEAVEAALSAPPAAVGQLHAEPARGNYAVLTWETPTPPTLEYRVYRAAGTTVAADPAHLVATVTTGRFADWQLPPDSALSYCVVAANGLGQTSAASPTVNVHTGPPAKSRGCSYSKSVPPHPSFSDPGDRASTDGVYAGAYADRKSYGYRLETLGQRLAVTVTLDLGGSQRVARATHHNCGAAGYRPDRMGVSVSTDGRDFTPVGATEAVVNDLMAVDFAETEARWVRFEFTKQRTGATDDWLFLDELEVY